VRTGWSPECALAVGASLALPLALALAPSGCAQGAADDSSAAGDDASSPLAPDARVAPGGDASSSLDSVQPPPPDASSGEPSADDSSTGEEGTQPPPDATMPTDAAEDSTAAAGDDAATDAAADAVLDVAVDGPSDAAADVPPSGCTCGARSVCVGGTCTAARRVFVSSMTYDGKLGGHAGADSTCQGLAAAANLGGTWMAWISDASSSPNRRFSKATIGYRLLDGRLVAANWTALASGNPLGTAIDLDEHGASLAGPDSNASKTWTATATDGTTDTNSCNDFASNSSSASGEIGYCTSATNNWTMASSAEGCTAAHHLYCFEQ
jgi:hypothetical protein